MSIDKTRAQFPFLQASKGIVYLDNAATTQKPQVMIDAVTQYYQGSGNPGRGNHQFARAADAAYEAARITVAQFIYAKSPQEIIFTRNTTEAINLVAQGLSTQFRSNEKILLSTLEHHSNLLPWQRIAHQQNLSLEFISVDRYGQLQWQEKIDELRNTPVRVIALTHLSNVLGTIVPIRKIFEYARRYWPEVITLVDAAQSIAHIPVNLDHLKCDFLAFSGHKVYGPTGIGALYAQKRFADLFEPLIVGGGAIKTADRNSYTLARAPKRFEAGTVNVAGAIGLNASLTWLQQQKISRVIEHEQELTRYLIHQLGHTDFSGLTVNSIPAHEFMNHYQAISSKPELTQSGILSLNIDKIQATELANFLDDDQILVRAGHHCALPLHQELFKTDSTLRISLGIYNTAGEIDQLIDSLQRAVKLLR